jgi:predicted ATP-grasp superfamily ATP-dependent carboligase
VLPAFPAILMLVEGIINKNIEIFTRVNGIIIFLFSDIMV